MRTLSIILGLTLASTAVAAPKQHTAYLQFNQFNAGAEAKLGKQLANNLCGCKTKTCLKQKFNPFEQWVVRQSQVKIPNDKAGKIAAFTYADKMQGSLILGLTCYYRGLGFSKQKMARLVPKHYDYQAAIAKLRG